MRYLINSLAHDFRLVFVDGPWASEMHDDLKPVYSNMGPCYRWANWKPHHSPRDEMSAVGEVESALMKTMDGDEGQGEWVGLLGFSQGAALAFSILLENQLRLQKGLWATPFAGAYWRFGIIMAGRAPPFDLSPNTQKSHHYKSLTQPFQGRDEELSPRPFPTRLRTPTLHIHGLRDAGLELHRNLLEQFASPAHTRLIEWDGAHRIPIKSADVKKITEAILEMAKAQEASARNTSTSKISELDPLSIGGSDGSVHSHGILGLSSDNVIL